jgi:hypothetical protein
VSKPIEVASMVVPEVEVVPEPVVIPPKENGRAKSTVNLAQAFKPKPKPEEKRAEVRQPTSENKPIQDEELLRVWDSFAESRKLQIAEFQLLKRGFTRELDVLTVTMSNPVEEPILKTLQLPLTTFLREQLGNYSITVAGILRESDGKKVVYTNKEKFEHLAAKNPALQVLKERLGLDTDY